MLLLLLVLTSWSLLWSRPKILRIYFSVPRRWKIPTAAIEATQNQIHVPLLTKLHDTAKTERAHPSHLKATKWKPICDINKCAQLQHANQVGSLTIVHVSVFIFCVAQKSRWLSLPVNFYVLTYLLTSYSFSIGYFFLVPRDGASNSRRGN